MARHAARVVFILTVLAATSVAYGRGYRIDMVPGGYTFECYMCHFRQPFQRLTVFGVAVGEQLLFRDDYPAELPENFFVGAEGNPDWAVLSQLDSDGDGYTNGEELGDPEGRFLQFDPQPMFPFSRPDLPEDFPCGSGTVEGPEVCDGDDLDGESCATMGFVDGALACADDCTFDTRACHTCGDGVRQPDEDCDGPDFGGRTCTDLGFIGGALRCTADCRVDSSDCHQCGDGVVQEGEQCDGVVSAAFDCAERGLIGEVSCTECLLDYTACSPLDAGVNGGDMGASDGGASPASDPSVLDAAIPDALAADSQLAALDSAISVVDFGPQADAQEATATSASPDVGGCQSVDGAEPTPTLLALMLALGVWRRRPMDRRHPRQVGP